MLCIRGKEWMLCHLLWLYISGKPHKGARSLDRLWRWPSMVSFRLYWVTTWQQNIFMWLQRGWWLHPCINCFVNILLIGLLSIFMYYFSQWIINVILWSIYDEVRYSFWYDLQNKKIRNSAGKIACRDYFNTSR